MLQKIYRSGDSLVVTLPKEAFQFLEMVDETEVSVEYDCENQRITIEPAEGTSFDADVDEDFALLVHEFIDQYRSALEELAR